MSRINLLSASLARALGGLVLACSSGLAGARAADPEVKTVNESRKGSVQTVDNITVTRLKVDAKELVGCMLWADKEGKAFFTLDTNGVVRKISFPELVEEQRLDLEAKCSWLSPAPEGLLVTVSGKGEVLQLAENLAASRTFKIAGVRRAVSTPAMPLGIAGTGEAWYILDLKKGGRPISHRAPGAGIHFESVTMTPDGKWVLATNGGRVMRFGFTLASYLKGSWSGPDIADHASRICLSPDGKHVALPCGGGNHTGLKLHPEVKSYSTYVYPVNDLGKPAFALESGAYPHMVGFDPVGGNVFAQNSDHQLIVFTYAGIKKKEYKIDRRGTDVKQYLAHPSGNKLLLLTEQTLALVELPASDK